MTFSENFIFIFYQFVLELHQKQKPILCKNLFNFKFWHHTAALPQFDDFMDTRGNHMENKKLNRLDTMDKKKTSENSNNGEYGKLKYKYKNHSIRNTPQKAGSSVSTGKVNFYRSYYLQYLQLATLFFLQNT